MTDAESSSPAGASKPPVATVYQNSDQIAGILQQIVRQPLIVEEARETTGGSRRESDTSGTLSGSAEGRLRLPLMGGATLKSDATAGLAASWTETTGTASRQQFVYSQAYYLHLVREHLHSGGLLTSMTSADQASTLAPGTFVEYTTTFDPAELTLALDVISPELVDAIARYQVKREYVASFPSADGHEVRVAHAEKMQLEADAKASLARAITDAVRADARQETTREYYGRVAVQPPLTAITICDVAHFIVDDPDRLLDGTFTVFGKIISAVEQDVPTFARNKLLRNLSAKALDDGVAQLEKILAEAPISRGVTASDYVDLKLDSRVRGASVRVMPLAIYS